MAKKPTSEKFGDIEDLVGSGRDTKPEGASTPSSRKRRPLPAVSVTAGDRTITKATDSLKSEIQDLTSKLQEEGERASSLEERLKKAQTETYTLEMPKSGKVVSFRLQCVDPDLIDVSIENNRIQALLDPMAVSDIYPSIRDGGQTKPGKLRPKSNGRFELIEGSRRLFSVKLANKQFWAYVGDVPDEDVRALSSLENTRRDVSPYEKAISFQARIQAGEAANWREMAEIEGISRTTMHRYKACLDIDEIFVRILPSPSDMPITYGDKIAGMLKKDRAAVFEEAKRLLSLRKEALSSGSKEYLTADEIVAKLTKAATKPKNKAPSVVFVSRDSKTKVELSRTSPDSAGLKLSGASEESINNIMEFIEKELDVARP